MLAGEVVVTTNLEPKRYLCVRSIQGIHSGLWERSCSLNRKNYMIALGGEMGEQRGVRGKQGGKGAMEQGEGR